MKKLSLFLAVTIGIALSCYSQNNGTAVNSLRGSMDALVYIDYSHAEDYVVSTLTSRGFTVTTATWWDDFDTKLATGNYSLAVAFVQGDIFHPDISILQNFIDNGGKVIYNDWNKDNSYAALFEATFTGSQNMNPMYVNDPDLANGLINPVAFDPFWEGTWSMGMTPIGSGQILATFPSTGDAAIILGNGGRTIILGYLSYLPSVGAFRQNNRQQLFGNVLSTIAPTSDPVPLSDWSLIFGVLLISIFMVIRYNQNIS
jgi:hypothetical protein